jgi:tetratricopeptide (TPR) repeat protein
MNKPVDALTEIQTAERLDPRSLSVISAGAMVYYFDRQFSKALEQCDRVLSIDPQFVPALKVRRWTFQAMGNVIAAKSSFVEERDSMGGKSGDPGWQIIESQLVEPSDERETARRWLDDAVNSADIRDNDFTFAFEIALAYEHLGFRDKALDWLERAERSGNHSFNMAEVDSRLSELSREPRFVKLLEKLRGN